MHLSLNRLQVRTDQSAFVIQPIFKKIILIQAELYKYIFYVAVIFLLKRLVCFIHKSINLNVIKICKPVEMFWMHDCSSLAWYGAYEGHAVRMYTRLFQSLSCIFCMYIDLYKYCISSYLTGNNLFCMVWGNKRYSMQQSFILARLDELL